MEDHPSLLQDLEARRHLGEGQRCLAQAGAGAHGPRSRAERGRGGQPVGQEHRRGRRRARLRRWQEGQRAQATPVGRHAGPAAQSQGPQRESDGLRGDQDAPERSRPSIPAPPSPVAGCRLPRRGQGGDWVEKALGWSVDLVERPKKPAPEVVLMRWAREWAKEGVSVDWQRLLPPEGFVVLPRRWVVERTIAW